MAFKEARISYQSFSPEARASMIMVLDQFPQHMETVHAIKEALKVNGAFFLEAHEAVLLARLVAPHYNDWAEALLAHPGIEPVPFLTAAQYKVRFYQLVDRINGVV